MRYLAGTFIMVALLAGCSKPSDNPAPNTPSVQAKKLKQIRKIILSGTTPGESIGISYADSTLKDTVSVLISDTTYISYYAPKNYRYTTQQRFYYFDPASKKLLKMSARNAGDGNYNNLTPAVYDYNYGYNHQLGDWSSLSVTLGINPGAAIIKVQNLVEGYHITQADTSFVSQTSGSQEVTRTGITAYGRIDSIFSQDGYVYNEGQYFAGKIPGYSLNPVSYYAYNYNSARICSSFVLKNGVIVYVPDGLSAIGYFHPAAMRKIDYVPGPDYDKLGGLLTPFYSGMQTNLLLQRIGLLRSPEVATWDIYDIYAELSQSYTDSVFKFTNDVKQFVSATQYTKNMVKDADGNILSVEQHNNVTNIVVRYEFIYF